MGQETSRTKPSMVAFEALARSPAMEVPCGECDAARTETIPQPASKQTLKNRLISSPFHWALHTLERASSRCRICNPPGQLAKHPFSLAKDWLRESGRRRGAQKSREF